MATHLTNSEGNAIAAKVYELYESMSNRYYPKFAIGTNAYYILDMLASELVDIDTAAAGLRDDLSVWTARSYPISGSVGRRLYDMFGSYVNQNKGAIQGVNTFTDTGSSNVQGYRVCLAFLGDAYMHGGTLRAAERSCQAFTGLSPLINEHFKTTRFKLKVDSGSFSAVTGSSMYDDTKQWWPDDYWRGGVVFIKTGAYQSGSGILEESGYFESGSSPTGSFVIDHGRDWEGSGVVPGDEYDLTLSKLGTNTKLYSEASKRFGVTLNTWIPTFADSGAFDGLITVSTGSYTFEWLIRGIQTAYYNSIPAHSYPVIKYHSMYSVLATPEALQSGSYSGSEWGYQNGYIYNLGNVSGSVYVSDFIDLGASYQTPAQWYYDWTVWTRPSEEAVTWFHIDARHGNDTGSLGPWRRVEEQNAYVDIAQRQRYVQYRLTGVSTTTDSLRIFAFGIKGESPIVITDPNLLYLTNDIVA